MDTKHIPHAQLVLDEMHLIRMLNQYGQDWIVSAIINERLRQDRAEQFQQGPGMIGAPNRG